MEKVDLEVSTTKKIKFPTISKRIPKEIGPLFILISLIIILSIATPSFFSVSNLINILILVPIPIILAVGQHFVIQTGSIDLSVEGVMAVSGIITVMLIQNSLTSFDLGFWGIVVGVLVGGVCGLLNGVIYVKGKVPSFIVTLGVSLAGIGLATLMYGGNPISVRDMGLQESIVGRTLGLPSIFWWAVGFLVIMILFEKYAPLSHHIKAVGGNEVVAKQAGVPVNRVKILVFMIAGMCYGLAGGLSMIRLMVGSSESVSGFLFITITAVIVGGTLLSGGKGSILGVLLGVFIIAVISNGMILLSVNPYLQGAIQGIVLIIAIAVTINRRGKLFVK